MENLFIQTNKNRQRLDLERIQRIQEANKRIASTVDKPQGYECCQCTLVCNCQTNEYI